MANFDPNQTHNIYYASGVPVNNQIKHTVISNNNMVPYNCKLHPSTMNTFMPNVNCSRNDYRSMDSPNYTMCKDNCLQDKQCQAWSFDTSKNKCYLNNFTYPCVPENNYVSGYVNHSPAPLGKGERISTMIPNS